MISNKVEQRSNTCAEEIMSTVAIIVIRETAEAPSAASLQNAATQTVDEWNGIQDTVVINATDGCTV
jgi:hypothetical protein